LDEIIDLLLDGQWHFIDDLAKALDTDYTQLSEALRFFEHYGFIHVDHPRNRVSIDTVIQALYQT
jgi:predicted transcriptional regulator